jgi:GntR family transcriptional repressor for pyruvate dehydrogenase complex
LSTPANEPTALEARLVDDPPAPLRRPNARRTEKVAEVVAREIVHDCRGLEPGTRLPPEARLLERYQVGRASLREALRLLEVQGLIVIRPGPGGGPMIAQADSEHFGRMASLFFHMSGATYGDSLNARVMLEPLVVGLIADRQDPEQMAVLREYLESSGSTAAGDTAAATTDVFAVERDEERALEFHAMLMGMAGNPVLSLMTEALQILRGSERSRSLRGFEDHEEITGVHDRIAQAILEGDRAVAEQLMRDHMDHFLQDALEVDPEYVDQVVSWH